MRPSSQQQAELQMDCLMKRRINGSRAKVAEHRKRARQIAAILWAQYQVGPYQYQQKHIQWYLSCYLIAYSPATAYRHWLTIKQLITALGKETDWVFNPARTDVLP